MEGRGVKDPALASRGDAREGLLLPGAEEQKKKEKRVERREEVKEEWRK